MIDGEMVTWAAIQPWVAELAGGTVLQELVLDRRLEAELRARGLTVTPELIDRERDLLARSLERGMGSPQPGAMDADTASLALATLRRERGLGETRFAALLRRSAGLRLLVQDRVVISDEAVLQVYAIRHGERVRTRIIVVPTQTAAADLFASLTAGPAETLSERFARAAREHSTDPSAFGRAGEGGASPGGGGLLPPFSPVDPAFPAVVRQAVRSLPAGGLSPVLALDQGFALVMVEEVIPPTFADPEPPAAIRGELEAEIRLRTERVQMDRAATELLGRPGVSILDRGVDWSWRGLER